MPEEKSLSFNDVRILQLVESNERLVSALDRQNLVLFGPFDNPTIGLVARVQHLEGDGKNTWEWRKSVDRRFLFSLAFQVANFVLLGLIGGVFVWALVASLNRGTP